MATIAKSNGTLESFAKSALTSLGATTKGADGKFYLDGNMVGVTLSQVIAEAIYIGEIWRNGQSVTNKYNIDTTAGATRIELDTPFDFSSRTLGYGGRLGTKGNGGIININPPLLPTNTEMLVFLNQINDQPMLFPELSKTMISLDVMAKKISSYAKSVVQDRSASTLAEVIAYSIFRSLNEGNNIKAFDRSVNGAYGDLLAVLNSELDNGDTVSGAYTFSTEGRTIIGRPTFINGIFGSKSGVILNGSDLAQTMLKEYNLDSSSGERDYVGAGYKGSFGQFHFQSAPDYIWTLAEKYLELPIGSLKNIDAVAVSFEATATSSIVDLGVKIIDSQTTRGMLAQPLNKWGHETFRKCQLVGNAQLTNDALVAMGFAADVRVYPIAPTQANSLNGNKDSVNVPIFAEDGSICGYQTIANGQKPNGGNFQSGLEVVGAPTFTPDKFSGTSINVSMESTTVGANIYYTTDGSNPTTNSTKYTAPISVTATTNFRAFATKLGCVPSQVVSKNYTK